MYLSFDDPDYDKVQLVHGFDHDRESTELAATLIQLARRHGHPDDEEAGIRVLSGPGGAAALQSTTTRYLDHAADLEAGARDHALEAQGRVQAAGQILTMRAGLPAESCSRALDDGRTLTRAQASAGYAQRAEQAAVRESRGDFEHNAGPPGPWTRAAVVVPLAIIETLLLIWPVTNADWTDRNSLVYFAGLVCLFNVVNHFVPKVVGGAIRAAREARTAAQDLTLEGLTAGRRGDTEAGRAVAGQVDEPLVQDTRHRALRWAAGLAVGAAVYASLVFTRVASLAANLYGGTSLLTVLAALLVTGVLVGALVLLVSWWAQGNALGTELREYGELHADNLRRQEQLTDEATAALDDAVAEAAAAKADLADAEDQLGRADKVVTVALQKASAALGLAAVPALDPGNLRPAQRPLLAQAVDLLTEAGKRAVATEQQLHATPLPFEATDVPRNPWAARQLPRDARPNLEFLPASQIYGLDAAGPADAPEPRRVSARILALGGVVAAGAVVVLLLV